MSPPCAGFIILTRNREKVLLIETHRGVAGFPKGKKEKNEDSIAAAYRELQEETGLTQNMIEKVEDLYIDEMSIKGNPATRLYIGYLLIDSPSLKPIDIDEIAKVYFESIDDAMVKLMPKRRSVLSQALHLIEQQ